ncbi:hypothetical protein [Streptomyces viridochromogenes]|uniref:hypothetical protein n=1 Tax=Streptomyces viridochromogenes TaxID=1938 RepID=UPI00211AFADA|nr:hypothetical protein [Streptomyces viridochromogenes]
MAGAPDPKTQYPADHTTHRSPQAGKPNVFNQEYTGIMTTPPQSPGRLPLLNMSLTHVTLPSSQVQVNRLTDLVNEVILGTSVIVIVLSTVTDPAESEFDQSRFTWPTWQGDTIPEAHQKWKAVFAPRDRTFRGLYYEGPTPEETPSFRVPPTVLSDAMWKMVQNEPCAVLCTGLTGDPSAAEITTALEEGRLQAVLVQALFA